MPIVATAGSAPTVLYSKVISGRKSAAVLYTQAWNLPTDGPTLASGRR